jgi:SAM-dependent methyltransferase
MDNTRQSFTDKWKHNERLAFDETLREGSEIQQWILSRNGFRSKQELTVHLSGARRILDAGCGNGRVTALLRECTRPQSTEIVGIDAVSAEVAGRNLASYQNVHILTRDLLQELGDLGRFGFIYCQEVLHHTSDPRHAFMNLCRLLDVGGEIAVYLYKRKGPVREFVDAYVHELIADKTYAEAVGVCEELTALGEALSECKAMVDVPAVRALGIAAGRYEVQRFISTSSASASGTQLSRSKRMLRSTSTGTTRMSRPSIRRRRSGNGSTRPV